MKRSAFMTFRLVGLTVLSFLMVSQLMAQVRINLGSKADYHDTIFRIRQAVQNASNADGINLEYPIPGDPNNRRNMFRVNINQRPGELLYIIGIAQRVGPNQSPNFDMSFRTTYANTPANLTLDGLREVLRNPRPAGPVRQQERNLAILGHALMEAVRSNPIRNYLADELYGNGNTAEIRPLNPAVTTYDGIRTHNSLPRLAVLNSIHYERYYTRNGDCNRADIRKLAALLSLHFGGCGGGRLSSDFTEDNVHTHPYSINPQQNSIAVTYHGDHTAQLAISDMLGRIAIRTNLQKGNVFTTPVTLTQGLYIVTISTTTGTHTEKVYIY